MDNMPQYLPNERTDVVAAGVPKTARNWAVAAHLSGLSLYLGIPFGNILGPLLIWLFKRGESPFIEAQAKEALNFQLSITIYGVVAGLLIILLVGVFLIPIVIYLANCPDHRRSSESERRQSVHLSFYDSACCLSLGQRNRAFRTVRFSLRSQS